MSIEARKNLSRVQRARRALTGATYLRGQTNEEAVTDLIADLLHFMHRDGLDPLVVFGRAVKHFAAECEDAVRPEFLENFDALVRMAERGEDDTLDVQKGEDYSLEELRRLVSTATRSSFARRQFQR